MKQIQNRNNDRMISEPVTGLILRLAVPTILSMLVTNIYNLVDAYFVGNLGTSTSGAIGIVLSIQAVLQAFGFMFGHGAGGIISRKLGRGEVESASRYASTSFFASFFVGILIEVFFLLWLEPSLYFLGCTDSILPYAKSYARYIVIAAPFVTSSCTLNNILRYEGKSSLAMVGLVSGAVLNMAGDPFLMFVLGLGMDGAGISTLVSQVISFWLLLFMFISGKSTTKIKARLVSLRPHETLRIMQNGFPSLIRQGLSSVSTMMLNQSASVYGDAAIAAMSIVGRITMFIGAIVIGLGQALQPVAAYNYGAAQYKRVKQAFTSAFWIAEGFLFVLLIAAYLVAGGVIRVFQEDPDVVRIGSVALRLQCLGMILQPLTVYANMMFQCVGKSMLASVLASLRSGIYFIPAILLLPKWMGLSGVQSAQTIADLLTAFTALPFVLLFLRELDRYVKKTNRMT